MSANGWDNSQTSSGSKINNFAYLNPTFKSFATTASNNLRGNWINFGKENGWTWENFWSLNPNSFNNPDLWLPKLPNSENPMYDILQFLQQ